MADQAIRALLNHAVAGDNSHKPGLETPEKPHAPSVQGESQDPGKQPWIQEIAREHADSGVAYDDWNEEDAHEEQRDHQRGFRSVPFRVRHLVAAGPFDGPNHPYNSSNQHDPED